MARSELEQLAESIRALADRVLNDAPQLHQRQHHISQLASRAARLAARSNDPGLKRVADLARIAASQLDDAIQLLTTTGHHGHDYAENLASRLSGPTEVTTSTAAPDVPAPPAPPPQPGRDKPLPWSATGDAVSRTRGENLDTERGWRRAREGIVTYSPFGTALLVVLMSDLPEPARTIIGIANVATGGFATWWGRNHPSGRRTHGGT